MSHVDETATYVSTFDEDTRPEEPTGSTPTCPECPGTVRTDGGERTCERCGLVVAEYRIHHGQGQYVDAADGDRTPRTGAPRTMTRHDDGLSTRIGRQVDGRGNSLSGKKRRRLARQRTQHSRARFRSKQERNQAYALGDIRRLVGALELAAGHRERAARIFRRAHERDLMQGRSLDGMAAASVYAMCRCEGVVRQEREVAAVARCERSLLRRCYQVLNVELGLEARVPRPVDFVHRFAAELEVPRRVRERAVELVGHLQDAGRATGPNPASVAAACLYRAGQERSYPLYHADAAEVAGVSEPAVRARREDLTEALESG